MLKSRLVYKLAYHTNRKGNVWTGMYERDKSASQEVAATFLCPLLPCFWLVEALYLAQWVSQMPYPLVDRSTRASQEYISFD